MVALTASRRLMIRNMVSRNKKHFYTIEEANKSLPLVRAIAVDFVKLQRIVSERGDRLAEIAARRDEGKADVYTDELDGAVRKLKADAKRLDELAKELEQLGLKVGPDGVVEFPAEMYGRKIFLSWQVGEPEVTHWRDPSAAATERVSLESATVLVKEKWPETLGL